MGPNMTAQPISSSGNCRGKKPRIPRNDQIGKSARRKPDRNRSPMREKARGARWGAGAVTQLTHDDDKEAFNSPYVYGEIGGCEKMQTKRSPTFIDRLGIFGKDILPSCIGISRMDPLWGFLNIAEYNRLMSEDGGKGKNGHNRQRRKSCDCRRIRTNSHRSLFLQHWGASVFSESLENSRNYLLYGRNP